MTQTPPYIPETPSLAGIALTTMGMGLTDMGDPECSSVNDNKEFSTSIKVAGGGCHTCAVLTGGTIKCWGYNSSGQLGDGSWDNDSNVPVQVSGIGDGEEIAAGHNHTCAVLADGSVQCWGDREHGQLGDGSYQNISTVPVPVVSLANVNQ